MRRLPATAVVLLGLILGSSPALSPGAVAGARRPNIVLIVTDDLNTRLVEHLPGLRRMFPEQGLALGLTISTPVCAPSRGTILTGRYAHNHGALVNGMRGFRRQGSEGDTFAVLLRDAGYSTGFFGKYLNGYPSAGGHVPPGWDRWAAGVRWKDRKNFGITEEDGSRRDVRGVYDIDFFSAELRKFVGTAREPFVAVWMPLSPHGPFVSAARHRGRFAGEELTWPPSFEANARKVAKRTRMRLEMMLAVEEASAGVLDELAERGILDRTYVFFTSDNGLFAGEHGFAAGKGAPYEETSRVPLYVRGPGVPIAASDVLVGNHDLAPTFLDLAGVAIPAQMDGRSFAPILEGRTPRGWRNAILLEFWHLAAGETWQAARTAHAKYVRWPDGRCEIFELRSDPYELAGAPCGEARPAILARFERLGRCRGAECAYLEDAPWPPRGDDACVAGRAAHAACRPRTPWLAADDPLGEGGPGL